METRDKLKTILTEWSEYELPHIYPRDFDRRLLRGDDILAIIGARRSGKTFLCHQIIHELRTSLPRDNIIYINFEDERLFPLKGDELSLLWDVCFELFSIARDKRIFIFVDEIQNMDGWSRWARRITEQNKNVKLVITGSSSKLLGREIATELRGRALNFIVYPLSFGEYLAARGIAFDRKNILYGRERATLKKQFNAYLKGGGFPATLASGQPKELLKEYFGAMFYKDLVERHKIKNIRLFEDYLTLLIDQTASLFSISSTARKLGEFGHSLSKNTLSNFSRYAAESFLIFEVKRYSRKIREQIRAPKKLYAIDHGLVQAIRFSFSEDYGRMMENIAYVALRRKTENIYYHKENRECDFLVAEGGEVAQAIQVSKSIAAAQTRAREVQGLLEAMSEHKLKEGSILTEDESDTIREGGHIIRVLPMWYWLL